jgi:hypothetical protein
LSNSEGAKEREVDFTAPGFAFIIGSPIDWFNEDEWQNSFDIDQIPHNNVS